MEFVPAIVSSIFNSIVTITKAYIDDNKLEELKNNVKELKAQIGEKDKVIYDQLKKIDSVIEKK